MMCDAEMKLVATAGNTSRAPAACATENNVRRRERNQTTGSFANNDRMKGRRILPVCCCHMYIYPLISAILRKSGIRVMLQLYHPFCVMNVPWSVKPKQWSVGK